jgi:hypothetical protein
VIAGSIVTCSVATLQIANYFAMLAMIADRRRMTTAHPAPAISEPLTWEQICKRYPDQWVCLVEFDRIDPGRFAFRTARVVGHDSRRRTAVEQSRPWWRAYEEVGQHFTGRTETRLWMAPRGPVRIDRPWDPMSRLSSARDEDGDAAASSLPLEVAP